MQAKLEDAVVKDALFNGRVALHQPARGRSYRVNVDALLLAAFAAARGKIAKSAVDLGAGVGAVALSLLHLGATERVLLIEIDARTAEIARLNMEENGWGERSEVVRADVVAASRTRLGHADLIVCNPPYVEPGRGRTPTGDARARARSGTLADFVVAARSLSARRGRSCFVYPAAELLTLMATLRGAGLEPKRMRAVHATDESPARLVLVEALPGKPGGLVIEAPLIERAQVRGRYTPEMQQLLGVVDS